MKGSQRLRTAGCILFITLCSCIAPLATFAEEIEIAIDVAPNTLNIQSASTVVTVHTDIAYGDVAGATVDLNGVQISWWKADNQGNFVAKFNSDEVKSLEGLKIGDYNTLTLFGYTNDGDTFIGSQDIMVIDVVPVKKGG